MKLRRAFMWAMIVSLSVCALAGIVVLLFPRLPYEGEVLGTAATVGLYSLVAMVCAIAIERSRRRRDATVAGVGIALAVLAMAIVVYAIWTPWFWMDDWIAKTAFSATLLSVNATHLALYAPARLAGAGRWIKRAAVVLATLFCVIFAILVWPEPDEEIVLRAMGALGILALLTSAITPIAWKMQAMRRKDHATPTMRADVRVRVTCPRCQCDQTIPLGRAKCSRCRLEFRLEIEEPRCDCGYPYLGLRAEHCPECGRPIPEADRWATLERHDAPPAEPPSRPATPTPPTPGKPRAPLRNKLPPGPPGRSRARRPCAPPRDRCTSEG